MSKAKLSAILILAVLLFGCKSKKPYNSVKNEYEKIFYTAIASSDEKTITDALKTLRNERAQESHIASLDYNIAQLLVKLKKNDEAIFTIKNSKMEIKSILLATLYIRIGEKDIATAIAESALLENEDMKGITNRTYKELENKLLLSMIASRDISQLLLSIENDNSLTQKQKDYLSLERKYSIDEIAKNMWPY